MAVRDGRGVVVARAVAVADSDGTDVQEMGVTGARVGVARAIPVDTMTTTAAAAVAQQQSKTINTTSAIWTLLSFHNGLCTSGMPFYEAADAHQGFFDLFAWCGIADSHVSLAGGPKRTSGHQRHSLFH